MADGTPDFALEHPQETVPRICDQCGNVIPVEGRRKIKIRRFCNNRCRNDWHVARRRRALERVRSAVEELREAITILGDK